MSEIRPAEVPSDANRAVYEANPSAYGHELRLEPVERELLRRYKAQWHQMRMLDLGIGGGRTTYTFAPLVGSYVGIDYAPAMVELARTAVGGDAQYLEVGDARDLSKFSEGEFDFILFSFNGLDYVGHGDRQNILVEVKRVLAPSGVFVFCSHSLLSLPQSAPAPVLDVRTPIRSLYRAGRAQVLAAEMRADARRHDLKGARERGWTIARDLLSQLRLLTYYVLPRYQLDQLRDSRLEATEVLDRGARPVDALNPPNDPYLYYICRHASVDS